MLQHGLSLLPDCRPEQRGPVEYYRDAIAISEFADQAGLGYVKMTEHYLGNYGGYCPSPLTFLAAVAARTRNIRLMTGALLPAFHHPVQIAAQVAQVDAISNGRVDAGFGRAWLPYEFDAFKVPMEESRARYEATIEAVVRLWTEQKVSEHTPFFSFDDATSLPPVVQRNHPPVWGAAVRSPETFAWLGKKGFGVMLALPPTPQLAEPASKMIHYYKRVHRTSHGAEAKPRVALTLPLYVARTDAEAYRIAEPHYREYLRIWTEATKSWNVTRSSDYVGYEGMGHFMSYLDHSDVMRQGTSIVGSPESVVDQIAALRETFEVDTFLWNIDFGGQDYDCMYSSLRLFVDKVIPNL